MKVRIGYGLGVRTSLNDAGFLDVVRLLENLSFDSLWLSERISGSAPDPIVAMSMAAATTSRLKFGMSVMVLPGRNPVIVAKELATLDLMSGGRLLPAFGLGAVDPIEQQAFGVERGERASIFNEALAVIRAAWSDEPITFHGKHFDYDDVNVLPKPHQKPPEVWLGGIADSELRRVGRLGEGWLPSFITPQEALAGWNRIDEVANEHGRGLDPEHFGVLLPYTTSSTPDRLLAGLKARRPDLEDVSVLVPAGWDQLRATIEDFIEVGASKFVIVPFTEPNGLSEWTDHLGAVAEHLLPLQS